MEIEGEIEGNLEFDWGQNFDMLGLHERSSMESGSSARSATEK